MRWLAHALYYLRSVSKLLRTTPVGTACASGVTRADTAVKTLNTGARRCCGTTPGGGTRTRTRTEFDSPQYVGAAAERSQAES